MLEARGCPDSQQTLPPRITCPSSGYGLGTFGCPRGQVQDVHGQSTPALVGRTLPVGSALTAGRPRFSHPLGPWLWC